MARQRSPRDAQAGFTLLEMLVALVIAALAIAALGRGYVTALEGGRRALDSQAAVRWGQGLLAELAAHPDAVPRQFEGDHPAGFHWVATLTPLLLPPITGAAPGAGGPPQPATEPAQNDGGGSGTGADGSQGEGAGSQGAPATSPPGGGALQPALVTIDLALSWQGRNGVEQLSLSGQRFILVEGANAPP